jgi:ribonuclease H / adenosylcobalamin/alpha-ribazole phosphatase
MSVHLGAWALTMARTFKLTADGGSRGNPGPAGYGAVVSENGKIVAELFDVIGVATNNVAEYSGLLAGLTHIHTLDPAAEVEVAMDSKLVVEQMSGRWQIKHADMRVLAKQCRDAHPASLVKYSWIPRDENSHADRLANKALDGGQANEPAVAIQENYLTDRLRSNEDPTMIYFVRHGETILTPLRKFSGTGPLNPELTEEGLAQAAAVAKEIAKIQPDVSLHHHYSAPDKQLKQLLRPQGYQLSLMKFGTNSHLVAGMASPMMKCEKSIPMSIRIGSIHLPMPLAVESPMIKHASA